jgi:hypothetical protein
MSVVGTMALPCQKLIDVVLRRTSDLGRATTGFKTILDALGGVFDTVYDTVYEFITGMPPTDEGMNKFLSDVRTWFDEVDQLSRLKTCDNISVSYKDCRRIEHAHLAGLDFIKRMDQMKVSPQHREPFNRYWTLLSKLYDKVIAQGARRAEPRTEPVVIRVFGKAGCGKSGLVYLLAQDLCAIEGMAENFMDELYFRNQVQEFWDGYSGQMVTVIDDFGQVRDSLGNVNKEFLEVIRCKNIAKWPLHMASLEQKSRTNFISRAVILTSNELNYDTPSITCKEALTRRMDITVECRIKEQYRVSNRDVKLDTDKAANSIDPNIYEFVLYDGTNPTCQILSYDEFSEMCCEAYRKAYCVSRQRLEALKQRGARLSGKTYVAQVASTSQSFDRCVTPALWLQARSGTHKDLDLQLIADELLTREQCDSLVAQACDCYSYNDFMSIVYDYCLDQGLDIIAPVSSSFDYHSLSCFIYDNDLTLNKRETTKYKFVNEMYTRFKETLQEYGENVRKGSGRLLLTIGGIVTGLLAMYSLKRYFWDKPDPQSQSVALDCPVEPGFTSESRDEKRPKRPNLRREVKTLAFCESRDEKRVRKQPRREAEFFNTKKCNCNIKAMVNVCYNNLNQTINVYKDDPRFQCNDSFCWICFSYETDLWMHKIQGKIREHYLTCDKHDLIDQAYDVYDAIMDDRYEEISSKDKFKAQAVIDTNAREIAVGPVAGNLYRLATRSPTGWKDRVNVLFVSGSVILTVKHTKDWLSDDCMIYNQFVPDGIMFRRKECQFIDLVNRDGECIDAMLIVLPTTVPAHRDLVSKFVDRNDINSFNVSSGNLLHLRNIHTKKNDILSFSMFALSNIKALDYQDYTCTEDDGRITQYFVRDGYEYPAETEPGDCGSPLVASNNMLIGKILGIHIAGVSDSRSCSALAVSVTRKMLETGLKQVKSYVAQIKVDLPQEGTCTLPPGNFIPIGKNKFPLPAPTKTKHSESPLFFPMTEFRESTKKPALLYRKEIDGELVDPLMKGLAKCGGVCPLIDTQMLERCVVSVTNFLKKNRDKTRKGPLTLEESIRGIAGDPYIRSINRQSSPGIPWVFQKKTTLPGKQEWLGTDDELRIDHPDLIGRLDKRQRLAEEGIRLETIWADTLKDELRPRDKVDAGKTRVFSAGPMDYVIFMRKYYLPFFAHMMMNRIDNFSAVGINAFDVDWHRLALKLKSKGKHVIDGDFANFDGTLSAQILWSVCDVINGVERDGCDKIRKVIFADIVNSFHLHADNIYGWTHSLTSGNPGTAIINTVYNILSMVYVFSKSTGLTPNEFFNHVYMVAYGDDNALCISDRIIDHFNMQTIAEQYKHIGMTYTDASKTGVLCKSKTLDDIGFLKRTFRFDDSLMRYVAPLELDTILEMTMWVTNSSDPHTLCSSNVDRAYHELALHGESIFKEWSAILDELSNQNLLTPPILAHYLDYLGKDFGY